MVLIAPLLVYDTRTWEKHDRLPGLPDNALTCIEARTSKRAVLLLKGDAVALWDSEQQREYATLDEDVQIHQVAFSPDESLVAISTIHKRERESEYWTIYRIRIWKMDTGELVHELRPFEQTTCENVVGLQWTADGEYVLAATKAHTFFTGCDINVWNVKSGRHRGRLSDGPSNPMGVAMLPDESHVAAGGAAGNEGSVIRFWDFAAVMKQVHAFENSLTTPNAEK